VASGLNSAPNYQLVVNPAYNVGHGPVHIFGLQIRSKGRRELGSFL
jgi:hypothetical protein